VRRSHRGDGGRDGGTGRARLHRRSGRRSALIRDRAVSGLAFLGLAIDRAGNAAVDGDRQITAPGADAQTPVIRSREDIEIAAQVRSLLAPA